MGTLMLWEQSRLGDYQRAFALTAVELSECILEYGFNKAVGCMQMVASGRVCKDLELSQFEDFNFDLALCPNYLFGANAPLTLESTFQVITELARVAKEVRIYPLKKENEESSSLLGPTLLRLQQKNYGVEVKSVAPTLHLSANAMLRVWALQCTV